MSVSALVVVRRLSDWVLFVLFELQVAKNRFDGELGIMLLKFDKETLGFSVKSTRDKDNISESAAENH